MPLAVIRDALSTLGTELRARTACGARLVLRADVAPSASARPGGSTRAAGTACQAHRTADGGCRARRQELHVLRVRGAHQRDRPIHRVEAHERRCAPCSAGACKLLLLHADGAARCSGRAGCSAVDDSAAAPPSSV